MADPLPGYLSNAEADALLAPVAEFELFKRDAMTLRYVQHLVDASVGSLPVKAFIYSHSLGSGGTRMTGSSEWTACLIALEKAQVPNFRVEPKTLLNRVKTIFDQKLSAAEDFYDDYVVICDDPKAVEQAIAPRFLTTMKKLPQPVSAEVRGGHFATLQPGALSKAELPRHAESIGAVAASLIGWTP